MNYIVANREKALKAGINLTGHRMKDESVILNEKEVSYCASLAKYRTLKTKSAAIGGTVYTDSQIIELIKDYE